MRFTMAGTISPYAEQAAGNSHVVQDQPKCRLETGENKDKRFSFDLTDAMRRYALQLQLQLQVRLRRRRRRRWRRRL